MKVSSLDTASFCELGYDTVVIDHAFSSRVLNSILDLLPETEGFVDLKKGLQEKSDLQIKAGIENISNSRWQERFGHLSQRLLAKHIAREFENFVVEFFEMIPTVRRARVPKVRVEDIRKNPSIDKNLPSISYRIVRASHREDVGFPHTGDSDFWIQGIDSLPGVSKNERRVKVWAGIYGLSKANTLHFFKGSHQDLPNFHYVKKIGKKKPVIDPEYLETNRNKVDLPFFNSPFMNIFHDRTIHFAPHSSDPEQKPLRISVECTVLILEDSSIFL